MPPRSSPEGLGALALVVAFGLSGCSGGGAPPSAPQPARPAQPAAAKPATPTPAAAPAPRPFVYEVTGRRDPFRPLIAPRVVAPKSKPKTGLAALNVEELKLAGIVWGRGFYALVEAPNGAGYVLRVNDSIGEDARVTKITSDAVTFEVKAAIPTPQVQAHLVELRLRKEE